MNITFLGPAGVTFSAIAYNELARRCGVPATTVPGVTISLAKTNNEILPTLVKNKGYGVIAMETQAEGRVDPPVNSFIDLLRSFGNSSSCPVDVIAALPMRINFALMVRRGMQIEEIDEVVAHPKAIGACKNNLDRLGVKVVESTSNGQAAEDVAFEDKYQYAAALAPIQAADRYGLEVLSEAFEDSLAVTTFFLLAPRISNEPKRGPGRAFVVFKIPHSPGTLVEVLTPLARAGISLRLIHSLYSSSGAYDFAIETECREGEKHTRALAEAELCMTKYIQFGPYPVLAE